MSNLIDSPQIARKSGLNDYTTLDTVGDRRILTFRCSPYLSMRSLDFMPYLSQRAVKQCPPEIVHRT
ncbi:MAG: hypothetical protein WBB28_02095 [Crinalium sp.]